MMHLMAASDFHIVLHAEPLFHIGGLRITNSMLLGWLVSALLVIVFVRAASKVKITTGSTAVSVIELLCDGVTNLAADVMHNRQRAARYAPFLITLFCFILFNNWAGLLPGVGTITYHGEPLFRPWTSDLTGTLALSLSSIVIVLIYSIRELGLFGFLKHYFSNKPWNPINLFVGLLEVLGELTRVASLALRLFGNVFAGEALLVVLSAITSYGSPVATLPFVLMEFFVGFIQAFVFTTLVIVYLTLATSHHDEAHESAPGPVDNAKPEVPLGSPA
jgi:F-type H+-transporting ATPase subunit a